MRSIFIIALIVGAALAQRAHHRGRKELSDEDKAKFEAIRKEKFEKLSPEAQEAGKKIQAIFKDKRDDKKAAHEEVKKVIDALPEKVREELESLRKGHKGHKGGKGRHQRHHHEKKPLTEEQKAKFEAIRKEKFEKLSPEAQEAGKKIEAIFKDKKGDRKAAFEEVKKVFDALPEKVREELNSLFKGHKGGKGKGHNHHRHHEKKFDKKATTVASQ